MLSPYRLQCLTALSQQLDWLTGAGHMPQVGSHWSEKAREDMTERDWRIFREDHNIAYRGAALDKSTLPIRNWQEAGLPKTLVKVPPGLACKQQTMLCMALAK